MENTLVGIRKALKSSMHYEERVHLDGVIFIGKFKECYIFELNGEIYFNTDGNDVIVDQDPLKIPASVIGDLDKLLASGCASMNINCGGDTEDVIYIYNHPFLHQRILGRKKTYPDGNIEAREAIVPHGFVKALKDMLREINK